MIYKYVFGFPEDNESFTYQLEIDDDSLQAIKEEPDYENLPEWTKLEFRKCPNCPYSESEKTHCPVAVDLYEVVERTKDMFSYKEAATYVHTKDRIYYKKADLQVGLFSLMGLIMASSTCKHFDFLKSQTPFHLPFASIDETLMRAASFHLFDQFLHIKEGNLEEVSFEPLKQSFSNLEIVNMGILERLRSIPQKDGNKNALVTLNIFAQLFASELKSDFSSLTKYFRFKKSDDEAA